MVDASDQLTVIFELFTHEFEIWEDEVHSSLEDSIVSIVWIKSRDGNADPVPIDSASSADQDFI